jgi:glucose/arabinose dehydrogenase
MIDSLRAAALLAALLPVTDVAAAPALCAEPPATAPIPDIALAEVASGLRAPVHIAHDGTPERLYVVEQAGTIRIVEKGKVLPEPFLDISGRVESGGEKGLLSVAFHPRHRDNGFLYVDYTTRRDGKLYTHVSRFRRVDRNRADSGSETVLLRIEQPYSNHNGGQLAFGPDGYLYIGMGDGGSANDPHDHGQNLGSLLGKILRIDVDGTSDALPYAIPRDDPFVNRKGARAEIWAYGLRNPWRFAFDPANGRLYAADVGQDAVEEIDVIEKGGNYGWRIMEGDICTPAIGEPCNRSGLRPPIHVYRHPEGFSVTGGFVYRGASVPGLCGVYLFADYVTQRLWGLRYDGARITMHRELIGAAFVEKVLGRLRLGALQISSFGQGADLELYVAAHQSGRIFKIVTAQ